jgi:transposase
VSKQLSVTDAAVEYGISRRHLHRLLARYREGGLDALAPRSRRPRSNPAQTPPAVRERVIELRLHWTADGLDAGPVTIAWRLEREGPQAARARDDQPDPAAGRPDHPAATKAPAVVLHAL